MDLLEAIFTIKDYLKDVRRPDTRVALFQELQEGYCVYCGEEKDGVCHCRNDE